jgi:hypothetical protein
MPSKPLCRMPAASVLWGDPHDPLQRSDPSSPNSLGLQFSCTCVEKPVCFVVVLNPPASVSFSDFGDRSAMRSVSAHDVNRRPSTAIPRRSSQTIIPFMLSITHLFLLRIAHDSRCHRIGYQRIHRIDDGDIKRIPICRAWYCRPRPLEPGSSQSSLSP